MQGIHQDDHHVMIVHLAGGFKKHACKEGHRFVFRLWDDDATLLE